MKQIKFTSSLVPLILSGEKTVTWRLFDDKDLQTGDKVEFLNSDTKDKIAEASLLDVRETTFGDLTDKDKEGYNRDEEMYKIFKKYYGDNVDQHTEVKIIKFKLL